MIDTAAQMIELENAQENLTGSSLSFARGILKYAKKHGTPSPKQAPYVQGLIDRANGVKPKLKEVSVGNMTGLINLFKRVRGHLKFPKIMLQVDEYPVQLSVAGHRSRYEGQINVTDGGPYGSNKWYGRVDKEGTFSQSNKPATEMAAVTGLLVKMSEDPAKTASEHGRLTGNCCFCNHKLKDERSTEVGYGPICAKKWGLPWNGKVKGV